MEQFVNIQNKYRYFTVFILSCLFPPFLCFSVWWNLAYLDETMNFRFKLVYLYSLY